jgi:hypothetical protein
MFVRLLLQRSAPGLYPGGSSPPFHLGHAKDIIGIKFCAECGRGFHIIPFNPQHLRYGIHPNAMVEKSWQEG